MYFTLYKSHLQLSTLILFCSKTSFLVKLQPTDQKSQTLSEKEWQKHLAENFAKFKRNNLAKPLWETSVVESTCLGSRREIPWTCKYTEKKKNVLIIIKCFLLVHLKTKDEHLNLKKYLREAVWNYIRQYNESNWGHWHWH